MDIVKNEICKLLTKRTVLILLFLLVLNPVLGLYTMNTVNDDGYTGKDYSALYGEISNYSREDVLPEIEQRQMTAEAYGRISLCSRVYKEALACLSYDEYLDSVNEKAEGWNSNNNQSDHYTGQRQETGHFYYCVEKNGKNNKDNRPEIQRNRCKK